MTRRAFTQITVHSLGRTFAADVQPYIDVLLYAVATRIYAALARATPVDTGYLRLSLSARLTGQPVPFLPGARVATADYRPRWGEAVAAAQEAIRAFKMGTVIQFGYTASYAPYVEDARHMVKNVKAAVPGMVNAATREVRAGITQAKAAADAEGVAGV